MGSEPGNATPPPVTPPGTPTPVGRDPQLGLVAELAAPGTRAYRFTAQITGEASDPSSLYCQATTWGFGDGPPMTVTPTCAPWVPGTTVPTRLETTHTYAAPGVYEITLEYGPLNAKTTVAVK